MSPIAQMRQRLWDVPGVLCWSPHLGRSDPRAYALSCHCSCFQAHQSPGSADPCKLLDHAEHACMLHQHLGLCVYVVGSGGQFCLNPPPSPTLPVSLCLGLFLCLWPTGSLSFPLSCSPSSALISVSLRYSRLSPLSSSPFLPDSVPSAL